MSANKIKVSFAIEMRRDGWWVLVSAPGFATLKRGPYKTEDDVTIACALWVAELDDYAARHTKPTAD